MQFLLEAVWGKPDDNDPDADEGNYKRYDYGGNKRQGLYPGYSPNRMFARYSP